MPADRHRYPFDQRKIFDVRVAFIRQGGRRSVTGDVLLSGISCAGSGQFR